jgi:hypothetical protein
MNKKFFTVLAAILLAVVCVFTGCEQDASDSTQTEKAAAPVADPAPGAVPSGTLVTLTSATEGAAIHYTTDGSGPDKTKTAYSGPITISAATIIKAVAVKDGIVDSDVLAAEYTISWVEQPPAPEDTSGFLDRHAVSFIAPLSGTETFTLTVTATDGAGAATFISNNTAVATVGASNGVVQVSGAPGVALITATRIVEDKTVTDTCGVVVIPDNPLSKQSLKEKFGVTTSGQQGLADTLMALHHFLSSTTPEYVPNVVTLEDYIDIPNLVIESSAGKEGYEGHPNLYSAYYLPISASNARLLVVGINSFLDKNDNTGAHVTLHFQNSVVGMGVMNITNTNEGGYKESLMRQWLTHDYLEGLLAAGVPDEALWAPKRAVWDAVNGQAGAADIIEDKLWLPTEWEMYGENIRSSPVWENAENQGRLEWYQSATQRRKTGPSGSGAGYVLASPSSGTGAFCFSNYNDVVYSSVAGRVFTFVPAFCVR